MQTSLMKTAPLRQAPFQVHSRPLVPPRLQHRVQPQVQCRAAADDPYTVLGVTKEADSNEINRAYTKLKWQNLGNTAMTMRLEDAHSALMLRAFNNRLKTGANKDIAYADREQLFPWRPRRWDATPKIIMLFGAVQLAMVAYGLQQPQLGQIIFSGLVGIVGNVIKQNAIRPPPKGDQEVVTEEEAGRGSQNLIRGFLLGVMATVGGMLLFSTPEMLVTKYGMTLPSVPYVASPMVSLKIFGVALGNWIMTSFFY